MLCSVLYRYGHHRDLHSFPTRRSSDLARAQAHIAVGAEDGACELAQHAGEVAERDVLVDRDRKSTRLNSSHSSISYAVFCLKKKTTPCSQNTTVSPSATSVSWSTQIAP